VSSARRLQLSPARAGTEATMIHIGNHMKMNVSSKLRAKTQTFYEDVLGCKPMTSPMPDLDLFEFDGGFVLGVFFVDEGETLSVEDQRKATWLEIKTKNVDALKRRLQKFGVTELDYVDKSRFYFQAPGGQVFRLAAMDGGI
jgi:hypothetical protein